MKEYRFKINGNEYKVEINSIDGSNAAVTVNGKAYSVEMEGMSAGSPAVVPQAPAVPAQSAASQAQSPAPAPKPSGKGKPVTAPLPGVIIEISVREGQAVKAGQKVAVLEAMKMENEIQATEDGVVTAIHVAKGDSVLEGANIVTIA